jgi:hypothetical protein
LSRQLCRRPCRSRMDLNIVINCILFFKCLVEIIDGNRPTASDQPDAFSINGMHLCLSVRGRIYRLHVGWPSLNQLAGSISYNKSTLFAG